MERLENFDPNSIDVQNFNDELSMQISLMKLANTEAQKKDILSQ